MCFLNVCKDNHFNPKKLLKISPPVHLLALRRSVNSHSLRVSQFYGRFDIGRTMADFELEVRPNVRYLNNRSVVLDDTELFFTTLRTKIDPTRLWEIQKQVLISLSG